MFGLDHGTLHHRWRVPWLDTADIQECKLDLVYHLRIFDPIHTYGGNRSTVIIHLLELHFCR